MAQLGDITSAQWILSILGGLLAGAGIVLAISIRLKPGKRPLRIRGACLSDPSHFVVGGSLFAVGYHVICHTLSLEAPVAPMPLALGGAVIASAGAVLADWLTDDLTPAAPDDAPELRDEHPS